MSFSRKQALWSIFLSPFLNGRVASFLLEDYIPSFDAEREHSKKKKNFRMYTRYRYSEMSLLDPQINDIVIG